MEIIKLQNLRHILACRADELGNWIGAKIQEGFGYLENLETLRDVEVHEDVVGFTKELENLSKLKGLGASNLTEESSRAICIVVAKNLNHLEVLDLRTNNAAEILDLEPISSSPPPSLRSLGLTGRLKKSFHWFSDLTNLVALVLRFSKLRNSPLKYLKGLPNLICLRLLEKSFEGEQLHFEEGSFPKLNEILLSYLPKLKLMKIDRGALPLLKELNIGSCPLLEEVPSGIQYLTKLKKLYIWHMPKEFVIGLRPKIQHIPQVDIS